MDDLKIMLRAITDPTKFPMNSNGNFFILQVRTLKFISLIKRSYYDVPFSPNYCYIYLSTYIYIYIYREREREREL